MPLLSQLHDQRGFLDEEFGSTYFVFIAPIDPLLCEALDVWRWVKAGKQPPYTLFGPEMELDVYLAHRRILADLDGSGEVVLHRAGPGLSSLRKEVGSLS